MRIMAACTLSRAAAANRRRFLPSAARNQSSSCTRTNSCSSTSNSCCDDGRKRTAERSPSLELLQKGTARIRALLRRGRRSRREKSAVAAVLSAAGCPATSPAGASPTDIHSNRQIPSEARHCEASQKQQQQQQLVGPSESVLHLPLRPQAPETESDEEEIPKAPHAAAATAASSCSSSSNMTHSTSSPRTLDSQKPIDVNSPLQILPDGGCVIAAAAGVAAAAATVESRNLSPPALVDLSCPAVVSPLSIEVGCTAAEQQNQEQQNHHQQVLHTISLKHQRIEEEPREASGVAVTAPAAVPITASACALDDAPLALDDAAASASTTSPEAKVWTQNLSCCNKPVRGSGDSQEMQAAASAWPGGATTKQIQQQQQRKNQQQPQQHYQQQQHQEQQLQEQHQQQQERQQQKHHHQQQNENSSDIDAACELFSPRWQKGMCSGSSRSSSKSQLENSNSNGSSNYWEGRCGIAVLQLKICMRLQEQALLLQQLEERYLLRQQLLLANRYAKGLRCSCHSSNSYSKKDKRNSPIHATDPHVPGVSANGGGSSRSKTLRISLPQSPLLHRQLQTQQRQGKKLLQALQQLEREQMPDDFEYNRLSSGVCTSSLNSNNNQRKIQEVAAHGAACTVSHQMNARNVGGSVAAAATAATQAAAAKQDEAAGRAAMPRGTVAAALPSRVGFPAEKDTLAGSAICTNQQQQQQHQHQQQHHLKQQLRDEEVSATGEHLQLAMAPPEAATTEAGAFVLRPGSQLPTAGFRDAAAATAGAGAATTQADGTVRSTEPVGNSSSLSSISIRRGGPGCVCQCRCGSLRQRRMFALPGETLQAAEADTGVNATATAAAADRSSEFDLKPVPHHRRALPQPLHSPKKPQTAGLLWGLLQHELQQQLQQQQQALLQGNNSCRTAAAAAAAAVQQALHLVKNAEQTLLCSAAAHQVLPQALDNRNSANREAQQKACAAAIAVAAGASDAPKKERPEACLDTTTTSAIRCPKNSTESNGGCSEMQPMRQELNGDVGAASTCNSTVEKLAQQQLQTHHTFSMAPAATEGGAPAASGTFASPPAAALASTPWPPQRSKARSCGPKWFLSEPAAPQPMPLRKFGGPCLELDASSATEEACMHIRGAAFHKHTRAALPKLHPAAVNAAAPAAPPAAPSPPGRPTAPHHQQSHPKLTVPVMNRMEDHAFQKDAACAGAVAPAAVAPAAAPAVAPAVPPAAEECPAELAVHSDISCGTLLPSSSNSRIGSLIASSVTEVPSPLPHLQQQLLLQEQQHQQQQHQQQESQHQQYGNQWLPVRLQEHNPAHSLRVIHRKHPQQEQLLQQQLQQQIVQVRQQDFRGGTAQRAPVENTQPLSTETRPSEHSKLQGDETQPQQQQIFPPQQQPYGEQQQQQQQQLQWRRRAHDPARTLEAAPAQQPAKAVVALRAATGIHQAHRFSVDSPPSRSHACCFSGGGTQADAHTNTATGCQPQQSIEQGKQQQTQQKQQSQDELWRCVDRNTERRENRLLWRPQTSNYQPQQQAQQQHQQQQQQQRIFCGEKATCYRPALQAGQVRRASAITGAPDVMGASSRRRSSCSSIQSNTSKKTTKRENMESVHPRLRETGYLFSKKGRKSPPPATVPAAVSAAAGRQGEISLAATPGKGDGPTGILRRKRRSLAERAAGIARHIIREEFFGVGGL